MRARIRLFNESSGRLPSAKLRELCDRICAAESAPDFRAQINIVFTGDREIRKLNKLHRRKDKATDVLSFNLDDPDSPDSTFGEIYVSAPTAARQATAYGGTITEEYLRLVCHGMLHLFGYDHRNKREERVMKAREELYLGSVK
jgi:probable rRNA maturation factor